VFLQEFAIERHLSTQGAYLFLVFYTLAFQFFDLVVLFVYLIAQVIEGVAITIYLVTLMMNNLIFLLDDIALFTDDVAGDIDEGIVVVHECVSQLSVCGGLIVGRRMPSQ
jgi:hypothetical protein